MAKIVVAVDEHPHADKVVDCAIGLAKPMGAGVVLVYVTGGPVPDEYRDSHGDALPEHYYEDMFDRTVAKLKVKIEGAGVAYEGVYGLGDPAKFIVETAKAKGAALIVVGIHGHKGIGRIRALGDVARGVIEASQVPVVSVP